MTPERENGAGHICDPANREAGMVTVRDGVWCDPCIADLVRALNDGGIETVASCCGHGHRPGSICLRSGAVLIIAADMAEADRLTADYPDINGARPSTLTRRDAA